MIANNALVSTMHCVLMKGAGRRGVVIKDTSTNGTLLNGKKMVKGKEVSKAKNFCLKKVQSIITWCKICSNPGAVSSW